jgi:uncharacterized membrane protein
MAAAGDKRVEDLEKRLAQVEARLAKAEASLPRWQPAPALPAAPTIPTTPEPPGGPPRPLSPLPPAPPGRSPLVPRPSRNLESLLGANWLARAGVLLLALGVVFFLRLAYDRGWVPIPGRYAIGIAGGLGLWVLGDALRGRRLDPAFAQVVAGGGAVILYVTLYVGHAIHQYRDALGMGLPLTLLLLAAASIALAAYALWRDLPLLGGVAASLATILLAPAGHFSIAGVLYATFLDTAILLAAAWRGWSEVTLAAILAANVPILAGFAQHYDWPVLLACSAVANGAGIAAAVAARRGDRILVSIQAGLALALLAAAAAAALDDAAVSRPVGWALLAVGLVGLALAFALRRPGPGLGASAAAMLILWPAFAFQDSLWTPFALGAVAIAATAMGLLVPRVRIGTDIAGLAAGILGLLSYWILTRGHPAAAKDLALALLSGVVVAAAGLSAWLAARSRREGVAPVLLGVGLLALLATLAAVLHSWSVTVSWAVVAVAAVVAGLSPRLAELRLAAFGLFGLVLLRIFAVDLQGLGVVARVVAFMATGALLLVAAFLYARGRPKAPAAAADPRIG